MALNNNNQRNYQNQIQPQSAADTILEIIQEKFGYGEKKVCALLETYQIIGNESPTRLLTLVTANDTYAIFSFGVSRMPPVTFSDLTIDNIFPINESFIFSADSENKIGKFQFEIISSSGIAIFYYYPFSSDNLNDFNTFREFVVTIQNMTLTKNNTTNDNLVSISENTHDHSIKPNEIDFSWLNPYRREDFTAIDRCIADGTKPLKKGESKFQDELKKHEHEYIIYKKFRIYCATWNVNGQPCGDISLKNWLSTSSEPPDIYTVALQELDLSPKAITFSESRPDPLWIRKIMKSLHPDAIYEELVSVRLVGMMLTIIVRKELRQNVTRCWIQTVGTGALNIMGNKGGVGVSMTLNEADICFVNSHLAAHASEVQRRNEDYDEITKRLIFDENFTRRTIDQHDHIFWIGDLNYRINEYPGINVNYTKYKELIEYDQLIQQMRANRVFIGYNEGEINFRPTYKYDPGTDNWDSSEKARAPAWCDRILWKGIRIKQITYESVMDIRLSDHKPVYSTFLTGIKTKDEQKYKRVHEEVLKKVDKYENDNQPQLTVEKTDIDFNIINFNEIVARDFTVANNCHLPVQFKFIEKNGGTDSGGICEKWIEVEPTNGNLITGTSLSIRIKLCVDSSYAWLLHKKQRDNDGKIPLDILVLHVENGRDIFITIMGQYRPSCFGFSVDTLCRTDKPINEYSTKEIFDLDKNENDKQYKVTMPREIFLLIDYLLTNGKGEHGIFSLNRRYRKNLNINEIRDYLDTWSKEKFPGTISSAAEALLLLLESPEEPILHPYTDTFLKSDTYEQCLPYLEKLTAPRKNVFLHICMFLRHGIEEKIFNSSEVVPLFGNILLKRRKHDEQQHEEDYRATKFLEKFIGNDFINFACSNYVIDT